MSPEEMLRDLSQRLGLRFESQDWGIVNADPKRLTEFISFHASQDLAPTQCFELGELILASANERRLDGSTTEDEAIDMFIEFIQEYWTEQQTHIAYWSSLSSSDEFPVAEVLQNIRRARLS